MAVNKKFNMQCHEVNSFVTDLNTLVKFSLIRCKRLRAKYIMQLYTYKLNN